MTKEPIMINDVNVAECEFYNKVIGEDAYCNIDEEHLCTCISYDNCYYKQLKRKEKECDQLKAELKEFKDMAKHGLDNYKDVGGCWGCGISFSFDELLKSYKALELSSQKQLDKLKAKNKKLKEKLNDFEFMYDSLSK
jgi:cell division protein FtsB